MAAHRSLAAMKEIYDPKHYQPATSVGYLLNRARTELLTAIDRELEPIGVTAAQYAIMAHVAHQLADSPAGLCKGIAYDPGAMTRMIDRLEAKKLIRRVRSQEDRRAINLELTDEGKSIMPKMRNQVVGVINRFLRGFTQSEARQFESFLQRVIANA